MNNGVSQYFLFSLYENLLKLKHGEEKNNFRRHLELLK